MAGQVVLMDYKVVGDVSKGFAIARMTLLAVGKVLEGLIAALKATFLVSFGTNAALIAYLENIKNKVNKLAKVCDEFSKDLANAINDHKKGDVKGKHYFGEGVRA